VLVFPVPDREKGLHLAPQVVKSCEAAILEATAVKDSEPDFNLIHPRGVEWRIMEVKPAAVPFIELPPSLPLMNVQIVPDDVDGSLDLRGQVLHESFQVIASARRTDVAKHLSGCHEESPNQRQCTVTDVLEFSLSRPASPTAFAVPASLARLSVRLGAWSRGVSIGCGQTNGGWLFHLRRGGLRRSLCPVCGRRFHRWRV